MKGRRKLDKFPLLNLSLTVKEKRTLALVLRLTGWDEETGLIFTRLFAPYISQAPGGAEGLIKGLRAGTSKIHFEGYLGKMRKQMIELLLEN